VRKIILTCAITGSIHTPSMSPYLPITPSEIASAAIEAAKAGASIVHLHARQPQSGEPTQSPDIYRQFLPVIEAAADVVINITTGGSALMPLDQRIAPVIEFQPEIASLNMGTMNLGLYEMLNRYDTFKHDWERRYLAESDDLVFKNTFRDIERILRTCADFGTRFEIECYDISHLYTAAHFQDRGLLPQPLFIQSVFGLRGGIGAHFEDVAMMKRTADRLFGNDYIWSVIGAGRMQMPVACVSAALMGGNVRVGLEDSLWDGPGKMAASNAVQVRKIRSILDALSLEVATPDDARHILGLKGRGNTRITAEI
jgi:uncharacterized protein (DUF849 family)